MKETSVTITTGTIARTLLFVALAGLLWYLRSIVLVVAAAVEPGIRFFVRRGLRRILAVILLYLLIAVVFFGVLFFFIPPVLNDAADFLDALPSTLSSLNISD